MGGPGLDVLFRDGILTRIDLSVDEWYNADNIGTGSRLEDIAAMYPGQVSIEEPIGDDWKGFWSRPLVLTDAFTGEDVDVHSYQIAVVKGQHGIGYAFGLVNGVVNYWSMGFNDFLLDMRCEQWSDPFTPNPAVGIVPVSSIRPLVREDVEYFSRVELRYARNEIFARHGRPFQTPEMKRYFESRYWYKKKTDWSAAYEESVLCELEHQNVVFISSIEAERDAIIAAEQRNRLIPLQEN